MTPTVNTVLEEKRANLIAALQAYDAELAGERLGVNAALDALGAGHPKTVAPPPAAAPQPARKKAARKPATARAPKRSAAPKAQSAQKLAAPKAIDEPTSRVGRLPAKVKVRAFEGEAERRKFVEGLVEQGYTRTKPMARLAPGLFDVIHTSSGVSVTWWPEEAPSS